MAHATCLVYACGNWPTPKLLVFKKGTSIQTGQPGLFVPANGPLVFYCKITFLEQTTSLDIYGWAR
jgi:hypothetical protein